MSKSRKPADADLFAAVMRDVKPLRKPRPVPPSPATAPRHPPPRPSRPTESRPSASAARPPVPAANPGIDRRTAQRLRKGILAIDRRIDLHGMTETDAHAALDRFVRQAWREGARMLLVITGKGSARDGGGVLRRNLPRWLSVGENAPRVLRIEQAQLRHGGQGAYYVLLRRQRGEAAP